MKLSFFTHVLAWSAFALNAHSSPIISEFLASNNAGLATAAGGNVDWIEIQNDGTESINLAGYHLTDDPAQPTRWALPAVDLAAGAYLIVFASGEDLSDPAGELHANFSLSRKGGYLALMASDGSGASTFENYPPQRPDISYGMAGSDIVYFETPSPGAENPSTGLLGFVADTKFSVDRGYFEDPMQVEITTATEDVRIIYTTDGRVPSKGSVFTGPIGDDYTGPITIDKTTTLRAVAMKDGFEPSNVDTQTYLFLNDVIRQTGEELEAEWGDDWGSGENSDYEMDPEIVDDPRWKDAIIDDFKTLSALSIVVEPEEFFSLNKGIYPGRIGEDGIDIPASAELLHPDGKEGFQIDCAIRIVGQTSPQRWKIKKLSMRLRFDTDFGPGKLRYPVYDDPDATDEFNTLTVDARHNNTWAYNGGSIPAQQREWAQYLRDQTAADLHRAMGGHSPHGRYVFAFVNGIFWGMYNLHERPDDAFNASYQGGDRADWEVARHGDPSNGGVDISGDDVIGKYRDLNALARDADDPDVYAQIQEQLDIDDFISYMLVNLGLANGDWGHKNYYVSRSPVDGKWRFHSWDAEKVFQGVNDNIVGNSNNPGPTGIHQSLTQNADYRIRFADAIQKHFFNDGVMSVEGLQKTYRRRTDEIGRAVILESARWGDAARSTPYTKEDWDAERDRIMEDYFPKRPAIVVDQFDDKGLFGDLVTPTFGDEGGHFEPGYAVEIKKSVFAVGDIYYTIDGSDPRLPGGDLADTAIEYSEPAALDATATVKARLFKGSIFGSKEWSPLLEATFVIGAVQATSENLAIAMINFHPPAANVAEMEAGYTRKDFEFLGLMNVSEEAVSLLDLNLNGGVHFDFANVGISKIDVGQTAFIVKNRAAFELRYGDTYAIIGEYKGSLSNDGERLLLQSGDAAVVDFSYNDNSDWPTGTDGEGAYLVLTDPGAKPDTSKAGSWRASNADDVPAAVSNGGNPGGGDLTYATWRTSAFAAGVSLTAPNDDADGDQFVNFIEFLMGGDPSDATSTPFIDVVSESDGLPIFELSHRIGVADEVTLETGRSLESWKAVTAIALESLATRPASDAAMEIRRYRVLQLTKDAIWTERFVRVSAKLPAE